MSPEILFFFEKSPGALPLYQALEARILSEIPDVRVQVKKTQISFANRRLFACASLLPVQRKAQRPDPYLTVTFGLAEPVQSPRISAAVQAQPNRWTHHVLIGSPEEIDGELLAWIKTAAEFAAIK